jgi:hypothetical protein
VSAMDGYCQRCDEGRACAEHDTDTVCGCSADESCRACGGDDALLSAFDAAMGPLR